MDNETIKIKYIYDEDYNPKFVTGAYGGPISPSEIAINFFFERQPVPKTSNIEIDEQGNLVKEEVDSGNYDAVRIVQSGIIVNLREAENIYNWLGKHIKELNENKGI